MNARVWVAVPVILLGLLWLVLPPDGRSQQEKKEPDPRDVPFGPRGPGFPRPAFQPTPSPTTAMKTRIETLSLALASALPISFTGAHAATLTYDADSISAGAQDGSGPGWKWSRKSRSFRSRLLSETRDAA